MLFHVVTITKPVSNMKYNLNENVISQLISVTATLYLSVDDNELNEKTTFLKAINLVCHNVYRKIQNLWNCYVQNRKLIYILSLLLLVLINFLVSFAVEHFLVENRSFWAIFKRFQAIRHKNKKVSEGQSSDIIEFRLI